MLHLQNIINDFPILKGIHYLDSAATSQKPVEVVDAVVNYYLTANANPHRSAHKLGILATDAYESSRKIVADFINAKSNEVVFTRSATESLNLLSTVIGRDMLRCGDEILIGIESHHSNCVNWQAITKKNNAKLVYAYLKDLSLDVDELLSKINEKTNVVALTHASNVTGAIVDVKSIIAEIRKKSNALIIVDGTQSMPHLRVDVKDLDVDFYVASGHKMLAPMGIGLLYGKEELLNKLDPFNYGGDMIEYVFEQKASFLDSPARFEAGTQNVGGAVGFAAAIEYLKKIGMKNIEKHERELIDYAYDKFINIEGVKLYTTPLKTRTAILSFNIDGAHPHDIATILDSKDVMIRSGHHCAQPLHRYLGRPFSARASFYLYNTKEDIDALVEGIDYVKEVLKLGIR